MVGLFGEVFFRNEAHNAEKTERGGRFSIAQFCMLRGKKEIFWFSSLGQQV